MREPQRRAMLLSSGPSYRSVTPEVNEIADARMAASVIRERRTSSVVAFLFVARDGVEPPTP
jgi:hypothetical protein